MPRFLIKTILGHCNCFLSSVVTDGKDERLIFPLSIPCLQNHRNIIVVSAP